ERGGVDLYLLVGDIRHRVDRQAREGPYTESNGAKACQDHDPAVLNGKCENAADHGCPHSSCSTPALPRSALRTNVLVVAMRSPAERPEVISASCWSWRPTVTLRASK